MKNIVISLGSEQQRRQHITQEFQKAQVSFEFFDAITPATLFQAQQQLGLASYQTELHQNEVACLFSHALIWQKMLDDGLDYVAIFEDDIHLSPEAHDFLTHSDWIPTPCEVVKLEMFYRQIHMSLKQPKFTIPQQQHKSRQLLPLADAHMGGGGYILHYRTAEKLLTLLRHSPKLIPVDHLLFRHFPQNHAIQIYQMFPALCAQDMIINRGKTTFPSALENVRNLRKGEDKSKQKRSVLQKIQREALRLFQHLSKYIQQQLKLFEGIKVLKLPFK